MKVKKKDTSLSPRKKVAFDAKPSCEDLKVKDNQRRYAQDDSADNPRVEPIERR